MGIRSRVADGRRRLRAGAVRRLSVDPRALVALRVSLGALILADLCLRARSLRFFYTDAGALPRATLAERFPAAARVSVYTLFGGEWWAATLFVLTAVAACALLAGYRPRVAAVCSLVLLVALHARNPLVLNGGDSLLRRTLVWSTFLPLGAGLSSGTATSTASDGAGDRACRHPAAVGLLLQPVVLYTVNAAVKLRGDAWPEGRAVPMVFSLDSFTVLVGERLAGYPTLLAALGVAWLTLLCCSPALVLATGRTRAAVVAVFATAHVGMALTLGVGLFPLVSVAALLPHLPPSVWDAVGPRWNRTVATLRGAAGRFRSRARRTVSRGVDAVGRDRRPSGVRRARAAAHRVREAAGGAARAGNASLASAGRIVAAALLVGVLVWNGAALGYVDAPEVEVAGVAPQDARWDMFAPSPPTEDVWYVAVGETEADDRVEAIRGGDVEWTRSGGAWTSYPSARWRKYLEAVRWGDDRRLRERFAAALCDRWDATHAGDLDRLTVYTLTEPTRLDRPESTTRTAVRTHDCSRPR
ncbi:HTTM domain-containing protein [Halobaculum lipolyticum]|uniref:HTTM domain-containing protein n=1 Tax=Halobaculum lipolyticum TaxID=3032001 RepID=A0ABD5WGG2_9EURY|nr:HTTM domain-containing protein [Halobaculum sp. DT31]